jgi:hypothetical protein
MSGLLPRNAALQPPGVMVLHLKVVGGGGVHE